MRGSVPPRVAGFVTAPAVAVVSTILVKMHSNLQPPAALYRAQMQVLAQHRPEPGQLANIKTQLDLVLLALEALTGIGSEAMLQAAAVLGLAENMGDRVSLWRWRQANPLRGGSGGRKKLDVEEARSLVLISCYLARQHQEQIRQAVTLLEELTAENRLPHEVAALGDYLDAFINLYQERMLADELATPAALTQLGLKLLVDLLFYSGDRGSRFLWLALLDRAGP